MRLYHAIILGVVMRSSIVLLCVFAVLGCDHEEGIIEDDEIFVKLYGDANTEQGVDCIETSTGGYLLVGSSNSRAIVGEADTEGESDFYILFVDQAGNHIRSENVSHARGGRVTQDIPSQVISTSDGGYLVVGTTTYDSLIDGTLESQSDIFLVKVAENGGVEFKASYGNIVYTDTEDGNEKVANEFGASVAEVSDGYFVLATTTEVDRNKEGEGSGGVDVSDILLFKIRKTTEKKDGRDSLVVLTREVYGYDGEDVAVAMVAVREEVAFIGRTDRESEDSGGGNTNMLFALTENRGFVRSARVIGGAGDEVPYRIYKRNEGGNFFIVGEHTDGSGISAFFTEISGVSVRGGAPTIVPGPPDNTGVVGYDIAVRENNEGYWIAGKVLENTVGGVSRNADMLLMRTDFSGALDEAYGDSRLGGSNYGGVEDDEIRRIIRLGSGHLLLFGTLGFEGGSTMMCLMKTNAEGVLQK